MNSLVRPILKAALFYVSIGWHVFPCRGKKPLTTHGHKDATTDTDPINEWWSTWPDANIGVRTGMESGLIVVDCDGQAGVADFESLERDKGPLPKTPRSKTGGGGRHVFFRHPRDTKIGNRTKIDGKSIDLRGDGGYVILPPSDHHSGRHYEWEVSPSDVQPANLPAWVREFVTKNTKRGASLAGLDLMTAREVSEGGRHDAACRLIGAHLGRGEPWGSVQDKALAWNQKNKPPLPDDEICQIVRSLSEKEQAKAKTPNAAATQRSRLFDIAEDCQLFRAVDRETFVTFPVDGHEEFWPVKSERFRLWLLHVYRKKHADTPRPESAKSVIDALVAKALFEAKVVTVSVRIGSDGDTICLDLCNDKWQVVRIDKSGWEVIESSPVRFRRGNGMLPLPVPVPGGSVDALRDMLNVRDDDWPLVVGWLISTFRPSGPFPLLVVTGEQGSSKSTTARVLQRMIDPSKAQLRSEPSGVQDLMIAAKNSWCLAFDNLSRMKGWLSDALCRLSTGGAFGTRQLYTDGDEILIEASRPVILTSIAEVATRSDLLNRCIAIQLPPIPFEERKSEAQLNAEFDQAKPTILGALLDAVVIGIQNLPSTQLTNLPRMADFARWGIACEPGLKLLTGSFLASYNRNIQSANSLALEASPIFAVLERFLARIEGFEGTATELLVELDEVADEVDQEKPNWPKTPRYLADRVRELAPNLRAQGYRVEEKQTSGSNSRKLWIITRPKDLEP